VSTPFDYLTVACFLLMAGGYFLLTTRDPKVLLQLLLAGIVFAVANQVGNADHYVLGAVLVVAGLVYAGFLIWQNRE
jgi:hypothetical protein